MREPKIGPFIVLIALLGLVIGFIIQCDHDLNNPKPTKLEGIDANYQAFENLV